MPHSKEAGADTEAAQGRLVVKAAGKQGTSDLANDPPLLRGGMILCVQYCKHIEKEKN